MVFYVKGPSCHKLLHWISDCALWFLDRYADISISRGHIIRIWFPIILLWRQIMRCLWTAMGSLLGLWFTGIAIVLTAMSCYIDPQHIESGLRAVPQNLIHVTEPWWQGSWGQHGGPIWGRQDPGGPHVLFMAEIEILIILRLYIHRQWCRLIWRIEKKVWSRLYSTE